MYTAFVIRAGETDFDVEERIQGALDLPLNAHGRKQASQLVEELRTLKLETIFTSPSQPALATAEILSDALGVPLKELAGLTNMDQGLWQGMLMSDLRRKHPRVYKQWEEAPESVCAPAGESCGAAAERVEQALKKPMRRAKRFAVVVSEPLASLVACVLQGNDVERIPGPPTGHDLAGTVEVVDQAASDDTAVPATFDSTDLIGF
ncbi:MAG: histidine phosphatase family protein [Planctomycetaceae bacterium]|nr:histidine phosphatase family protein [Planctomycetaceae bacterium]